jgi:predicted transcriptional regulator
MAKLVKKDNREFTQISNAILAHPTLSLKAKGLYAFMYSKDNDWNFTIRSMASQLKEDKNTIQRILVELKEIGLITYTKHVDGTGTYLLEYQLPSETPKNSQNPKMPTMQNAYKAKCGRINNTDINNNKEDIKINPVVPTEQQNQGNDQKIEKKKEKLTLSDEVAEYRKKIIDYIQSSNMNTMALGHHYVENVYEQVGLTKDGKLFTKTRSTSQLLSSTINEIWISVYELASENSQNRNDNVSKTNEIQNSIANLTQEKKMPYNQYMSE